MNMLPYVSKRLLNSDLVNARISFYMHVCNIRISMHECSKRNARISSMAFYEHAINAQENATEIYTNKIFSK